MNPSPRKYLLIDLSQASSRMVNIPRRIAQQTIGGVGLATWLLLKHDAHRHDPFDKAASVVFAFSPLVGSPLTTSAKFVIAHRSPLTGFLNDSMVGSRFAIAGKKSGINAIVITGTAQSWSVIKIENSSVELIGADDLEGESSASTEAQLKSRFGNAYQVAAIGRAGENRVRYATISHDGRHAGRGGAGAMMGAKKIKAICILGNQTLNWAHAQRLTQYAKNLAEKSLGPETLKYRELGTASNLEVFNRLKILPTKNFQQSHIPDSESVRFTPGPGSHYAERTGCVACTIGCEHRYRVVDPDQPDNFASKSTRVEYESLFALGPLCGINDRSVIIKAMEFCDEYGLDTISTGGTIAFAMECGEKKLIDWAPRFGDSKAFIDAIHAIGNHSGCGKLLALGSRNLAERIGQGSIDFAPQIKGLELPGYELRSLQTMALGLAVNTRGADHNRSSAYEADFSDTVDRKTLDQENVKQAVATENRAALMDSLILCKFLRHVFDDIFEAAGEMLELTIGGQWSADRLRESVSQIINMKKYFNICCGWQPKDDTIPERFFTDSANGAHEVVDRDQFENMVREYNRARNWDDQGWLTNESAFEIEQFLAQGD